MYKRICSRCGSISYLKSKPTSDICRSCSQKDANSKREKTFMDKYGIKNPMESKVFIDKITSTFEHRYGVRRAVNVDKFRHKMEQTMIEKYGVPYFVMSEEYRTNSNFKVSETNKHFASKLDELSIKYVMEYNVGGFEYDFYLPESNILIEINPTYTHSIVGNHWNKKGLDPNYHVNKTECAIDNGYRCIHVWDWDNLENILNLITKKSRVFARTLTIKAIDKREANKFLKDNHIQGWCKGNEVNLALVDGAGVVHQVMTFGKPRYNKKYQWELLRLCSIKTERVVGGASKLFKFFIKNYQPDSIISYCDASKFDGSVYEAIGMKFVKHSDIHEVWSRGTEKVTSNLLNSLGYDKLFNTSYGKGTDNQKLMIEHGWLPVFDCGQYTFEWKSSSANLSGCKKFSKVSACTTYEKSEKILERKCKFCGKTFTPKSNNQWYCKEEHYRECPICGKKYLETNVENLKRPPHACSSLCRSYKIYKTKNENLGREYMSLEEYSKHKSSEASIKVPCTNKLKDVRDDRLNEFVSLLNSNNLQYSSNFKLGHLIYDLIVQGKYLVKFWNSDDNLLEYRNNAIRVDYRFIGIYPWENLEKIVNLFVPKETIYARDCRILKLNNSFARQFIDKYHLQGSCRGQSFCLGLVKDGELFQAMTFGKPRYNKNYSVELLRLCTKSGYRVVGGASRLFTFATLNFGITNIISYCDISKFNGDVYRNLGMKLETTSQPNKNWYKNNKRISDNLLRSVGYDYLFKTKFGKGKSNSELMIDNGWIEIKDCGQLVFSFN